MFLGSNGHAQKMTSEEREEILSMSRRNPMKRRYRVNLFSFLPIFLGGGVLGPHFFTHYRGEAGQCIETKISPSDPFLGKKIGKVWGTFQRLVSWLEKGGKIGKLQGQLKLECGNVKKCFRCENVPPPLFLVRVVNVTNVLFCQSDK